ncbi:hypothetical protein ACV1EH_20370, partial [Aeromonas caviae]
AGFLPSLLTRAIGGQKTSILRTQPSNKPHSRQLNEVSIVTALVVNLVETYSSRGAYKGAISAWRVSSDMANKISTVIGVYKSQVVVVIEGCQLKLSTPDVNELHDDGCDGR